MTIPKQLLSIGVPQRAKGYPAVSRSMAMGRRGMVASGHTLASAAGISVLAGGGNAVDAAIAMAGVLGVVQPMMSGVGGDTFIVLHHGPTRQIWALNGSGIAPYAATREYLLERGHATMPPRGMLAPGTPGAVDAMAVALERWGSGRYTLARLLEPAIHHAEEGFPVTEKVAQWTEESAPLLARYPSSAKVFLPQGRPPAPGEVLYQKDLAQTLRAIATGGREEFYRGQIARAVAAYMREHDGLITERELAEHRCDVYQPLVTTYRGVEVHGTAPPSQGAILLEMLNLLEGFDLASLGAGSAAVIHLMVEAKKLAFADRLAYLGDPRFVKNPLDVLLSKPYAARRRREISQRRATAETPAGALAEVAGDTTYLCTGDAEGTLVSYITSLSNAFGCAEIVEGTGILLNNRVGRGFTLEENHPNVLAPGKRTMHTLMCFLACRDGVPLLAWGTPGGDGQAQWCAQALTNLVDFGMGLQEAVDAPRWLSHPGTDPVNLPAPFELRVEASVPEATRAALAALGHRVTPQAGFGGGMQAVLLDRATGILHGASDPRVDGCAIGL